MKEEILNEDLALDIERAKNMTLLGDRTLILLDKEEDTTTQSGIIIPKMKLKETDGGKLRSEPDSDYYTLQGTILNMSSYASEKLSEIKSPLSIGDKVLVSKTAKQEGFQFFPDRSKLVQYFKGIICLPHTLIEAKI